jgi:hypothetical protein
MPNASLVRPFNARNATPTTLPNATAVDLHTTCPPPAPAPPATPAALHASIPTAAYPAPKATQQTCNSHSLPMATNASSAIPHAPRATQHLTIAHPVSQATNSLAGNARHSIILGLNLHFWSL